MEPRRAKAEVSCTWDWRCQSGGWTARQALQSAALAMPISHSDMTGPVHLHRYLIASTDDALYVAFLGKP